MIAWENKTFIYSLPNEKKMFSQNVKSKTYTMPIQEDSNRGTLFGIPYKSPRLPQIFTDTSIASIQNRWPLYESRCYPLYRGNSLIPKSPIIRNVRMFEFTKTQLQTQKLLNIMNKYLVKPIAIIVFQVSFALYIVNFAVED